MFISNAYAASAPAGAELMSFLPMIVIFALFWFMLIRPQMKQAKEQRKMQDSLQKGDEITTMSGIVGRVVRVTDNYIDLEVADNTVMKFQRQAVQNVLPKGTIKSL